VARTVRVYHDEILQLADDPDDPIGDLMEQLAEEIEQQALENARVIIPSLPEGFLTVESGKDSKGLFFRVRTDGQGHLSAYLNAKESREHAWFEPAVAEVVGPEALRIQVF
jgi:hypothetical protein